MAGVSVGIGTACCPLRRVSLHRHHAIAPAAEAPIVFRTYQRRGMNRHEIGVKILGGEGSRPCRSPPTPQPWTWLGYGYTITCPRALHCPAAAAHGQCLAITDNAAPSINQSIVPRCTRRRAVPLQTRSTGDARLTPAPPVAALITRKPVHVHPPELLNFIFICYSPIHSFIFTAKCDSKKESKKQSLTKLN